MTTIRVDSTRPQHRKCWWVTDTLQHAGFEPKSQPFYLSGHLAWQIAVASVVPCLSWCPECQPSHFLVLSFLLFPFFWPSVVPQPVPKPMQLLKLLTSQGISTVKKKTNKTRKLQNPTEYQKQNPIQMLHKYVQTLKVM